MTNMTEFPARPTTPAPPDPWDTPLDAEEVAHITDALLKPFPPTAIKRNKHSGLLYVEYQQIIRRLITATGNRFSTEVVSLTERPWTKAKKSGMDQVLVEAVVRLTIPALGSARTASGYQVGTVGAGEDLRKGAVSDAIKKAAQQFGVAIDLAGMDGEDMTVADLDGPPAQQPQQPQRPQRSPRDQVLYDLLAYCEELGVGKDALAAMTQAEYGKPAKDLTEAEAKELNQMIRKLSADELRNHATECLKHVG